MLALADVKERHMKIIKIIVLGLGLLAVYPLVFINRITAQSTKLETAIADYVLYFCKQIN
jgi:hypothetical protein